VIDTFSHFASNVGIDHAARLYEWGRWAKRALKCRVVIAGSSLRSKDWRDVDVTLVWPDDQYDAANRFFGVAAGRSSEAWWFLCSALSLQATASTGIPVEVHLAPVRDWFVSGQPRRNSTEFVEVQS
jgi:hypothetical protein